MAIQGRYDNLNGLTSAYGAQVPFMQQQAQQASSTTSQNIGAQNTQMTGQAPLVSATAPIQEQSAQLTGAQGATPPSINVGTAETAIMPQENATVATTQWAQDPNVLQGAQTSIVGQNLPAPQNCGTNLDCKA